MERSKNTLALNVMPASDLLAERAVAEEFVRGELDLGPDELPDRLKVYRPHIAVAKVQLESISRYAREHPEELLKRGGIPRLAHVALEALPEPSAVAMSENTAVVA